MATRACPQCKAQYVASVRRCIDCDLVLVDEVRPEVKREAAAKPAVAEPDGDQVGYELEGWGNQLKVALEGMLDKSAIPRAWESGALVVPAIYEDEVDRLIATFEGAELGELPDEDTPQVAFEFEGLSADELSDLDARLIADHIPHAWDDNAALLVAEADEEAVAALIEEVLEGPAEDDDDGLATQDALSELFVAVDKLQKDPADHKLVTRYVTSARAIGGLAVPYGLAGADWQSLVDEVHALATHVEPGWDAPPVEDDVVDADEDGADADGDEAADGADAPGVVAEADVEAADEVDAEDVEDVEVDAEDVAAAADEGPEAEEVARDLARALRARLGDLV